MIAVKNILKYALFLVLVSGIVLGVTRSQEIIDWWRLRDYKPSAAIEALTLSAGMNDEGKKLFYVHDPQLLKKDTFSDQCTINEETIVLGCYLSHQRIYIFDVDDDRLNGVEEVTAGHEMLHAAYDRLSESEQDALSSKLVAAFNNIKNDRIKKNVETYRKRDASVVGNELHSILGTEVRELPQELEEHFATYFKDRQKIVDLAEKYAAEFERRQAQIAVYDVQLESLKSEIAIREAEISSRAEALNRDRAELQALANDPPTYNAAIGAFNSRVNFYNSLIRELRNTINQFNEIVDLRNKISSEEKELVDAIDSRVDGL